MFQEAVKLIDDGYAIIVAYDGKEGVQLLEEIVPDYIFLDMNMPIMNGKETLRRIRNDERFQAIPICILSTSNDRQEFEYCRALGASQWIVKPDSFQELVRRLKSVLLPL